MAAISKRTFLFTDDQLLLLANEEWVRTLPNGNNWSRIRLGFLAAVSSNGTNNITDATLFFGLCAGKTAPSGANNVQNFFGASLVGNAALASARTLTYNANSNLPYYSGGLGQIFRRFNQTITAASMAAATILPPAATGNQRRRIPVIMDISRQMGGGGLYTITIYGVSTTTVAFDYRSDHLLDAIDQLGTPTIYGQTLTVLANAVATVNASEVEGGLDSVCLYWGRQTFPLEVYAIGASVINDTPFGAAAYGGALDTFESYTVGTITGVGGTISGGNGFSSAAIMNGTGNLAPQLNYAGTSSGFPVDSFDSYALAGSITGTFFSGGSGWSTLGIVNGTANPGAQSPSGAYAGTTSMIYDSFESYAVGAVTSGVTVNAGLAWSTYGTIN